MTPEEMDNLGKGLQGCGCALTLIVLLIAFFFVVFFVGC